MKYVIMNFGELEISSRHDIKEEYIKWKPRNIYLYIFLVNISSSKTNSLIYGNIIIYKIAV
jgi:hypothetical protein